MVINDQEIRLRTSNSGLLKDCDLNNVENCGYSLRLGNVFKPSTGEMYDLSNQTNNLKKINHTIKPSEVLIVMTKESVKVPDDLCGSFNSLHSLASKGLMLLNASIVEPGYEGHLSCFIVNFSNQNISLSQNEKIAKLIFHKLSSPPHNIVPLAIHEEKYKETVSKNAILFSESFLDIGNLEEKILKKVEKSTNSSVKWGGVLIAFLLLWATLEPIISRWFWRNDPMLQNESNLIRTYDLKLQERDRELKSLKTTVDSLKAVNVKGKQTPTR